MKEQVLWIWVWVFASAWFAGGYTESVECGAAVFYGLGALLLIGHAKSKGDK